MPDNSATVIFETGSVVGCTDDGITSTNCADASQIIVGTGGSKWTYKGSDIDDFDDLPKPSIMDNTGGSLPIYLLYFDGYTSNSAINLIWATSYEENFDYFELEKSVNAVDFTTLGQLYGKGGLDLITHYQFIDESPFEDINYYRLKSIDHDGTFEYHPVISVNFDGTYARELLVYPNPVQGKGFTIRPNFDFNKALIRIKDLNGRMVLNEVQEYPSKTISIPSYLEAGVYLLEFVTKEGVELEKLIIK